MSPETVAGVLRDQGLKVTPRRLAAARLLFESGRAMTPDEVRERLRPKLGRLGLPTVYRIMDELADAGLLTRVEREDRLLSYAACQAERGRHHHHIVCTRCGRVEVVGCAFPAGQRRGIERRTGFRITGHRMQVEGLCPDCRRGRRRRC
jgi:Fur family ferric uptake transcriptional regulator